MQHREKRRARTCKRMSGARDGEYDGGGGTASGKADHFHDADDKVFAAGQGLVVEGVAVLGATVLQGAVDEQPHAVPAASGERESGCLTMGWFTMGGYGTTLLRRRLHNRVSCKT